MRSLALAAAAAIITGLVQFGCVQAEQAATRLYWKNYVHGVESQRRAWEEGLAPRG